MIDRIKLSHAVYEELMKTDSDFYTQSEEDRIKTVTKILKSLKYNVLSK